MKRPNRRVVLCAGAMCGFMAGIIYIWSIYRNPLMELHGWSSSTVTLAYSLFALMMLASTFLAGPLQKRASPRVIVAAGGLLQGCGLVLTGFVDTPIALYITYSLIAGGGNGIIYSSAVSVATAWFPDKRGFANGLCIGAMGLAPLVFAPLGNWLIGSFGVSFAFIAIGLLTGIVLVLTSLVIQAPPAGWKPAGWNPGTDAAKPTAGMRESGVLEMLRTSTFWILWATFACAVSAGVMMTGQASAIGQHVASIGADQGAVLVAALAVASFLGRLCLGSLSDRIGRYPTLCLAMSLSAVDLLFFMGSARTFLTFLAAMFVVGFGFGGIMASMPNVSSDNFGIKSFPVNYPLLFSAYGAASFVGPLVASYSFETTGEYALAFLAAGVLSAAGAIVMAFLAAMRRHANGHASLKGGGRKEIEKRSLGLCGNQFAGRP